MIVFLGSCLFIINDVLIWIITLFNDILRFNIYSWETKLEISGSLGCGSVGKTFTAQA